MPARDPGRRALALRRSACAHARLSPAPPAARRSRISVAAFGPAMTRVAARHADEVVLNLVPPEHVGAGARDGRRRGGGRRPHRPGPGRVGAGRAGAGRRGAGAARRAARGLPRCARIRRDVQRARVRRARRAARARAPGDPSSPRSMPFELLERVGAVGTPRTSSRASAPITTPAPTWSASCRPRPRIRAADACWPRCPSASSSNCLMPSSQKEIAS